jgi:hypothetical protein
MCGHGECDWSITTTEIKKSASPRRTRRTIDQYLGSLIDSFASEHATVASDYKIPGSDPQANEMGATGMRR